MRFFFSAELDSEVSDAYREIRSEIENHLNTSLATVDYGKTILEISIIPMTVPKRPISGLIEAIVPSVVR